MNEEFWKNVPKAFCEDTSIAVWSGGAGSMILLGLRSGSNAQAFALTPEHAKRLMQYLTHEVAEFEKKIQKIEGEDWTPSMKTPYEFPDLGKGNTPEKK